MSILIRVLPFWILGILAGWALPSIWNVRPALILPGWIILASICCFSVSRPVTGLPRISLSLMLLTFCSSFQITLFQSSNGSLPCEEQIQVSGRIYKVWEGQNYCRIKLMVHMYNAGGGDHECREPVLLHYGQYHDAAPSTGDCLRAVTKLERISKKAKADDFPERLYWAGEGIRKKGWLKEAEYGANSSPESFNPILLAGTLQKTLCGKLDSCSMGEDQSAIIKAMLLGRKDYLSSEVKNVFQHTGISHLLAVSGLHAGLIYMIFTGLLFPLKGRRHRFLVEILAVTAVWSYALMTGFSPSVQRAAGMISLFALSRMINRRADPLQVLVIACLIQTAADPLAVFRLGFQLSYLAVAGIFIFYSSWTRLIRIPVKILRRIWDFAGVSIAAQTLTLPFVLIYFHEFPLYFLLGNLLLVPLGLMVFYFSAAYLSILTLGISIPLLEHFLELIIKLMVGIGEGIAAFPHAIISFDCFSPVHMTGYYMLLAVLFIFKGSGSFKRLFWFLSLALVFSMLGMLLTS